MNSPVNSALEDVVLKILRPLARVLLHHGVAHGTFEQLARKAFVDAGFSHLQDSGLKTTVSGVSALTGLSRKEVTRLQRMQSSGENQSLQRYNRAVRIISGWVNDARFLDNGAPAVLPIDSGERSFAELVRAYSGDVPVVALLNMLQDSGNVRIADGSVHLVKRSYIPMQTEPDKLNILGTDTAELIETISHNFTAPPEQRFFQRKVSTQLLRADATEAFRDFSRVRSQQLLEEHDAWLAQHEVSDVDDEPSAYVAVGIYYSERVE
jgi:hypothetical protein